MNAETNAAEIATAKNAFNSFLSEVEYLQDVLKCRFPGDATTQSWYLDALKRQAELLQAQLDTAIRFVNQAQNNLKEN